MLGGLALADVTVSNQTNETLYVGAGHHVNGKEVYFGWAVLQNGMSAKVYAGGEAKIILCMFTIRNGQRVFRTPSDATGSVEREVSSDGFRVEQIGGPANEWKFTDVSTNQIWFKDNNNGWPPNLNLFRSRFWIVNGHENRNEIP